MDEVLIGKSQCGDCGLEMDESPHLSVVQRQPCSNCGSMKRKQFVTINCTTIAYPSMVAKGRRNGVSKPFIEILTGADFSRRLQRFMRKLRIIDREGDKYHEEVTDPTTGQTIHYTKEKLSKHIGHHR